MSASFLLVLLSLSLSRYHVSVRACYVLYRFVDRDGDGYITADDIFAVQAMLMQRSEVFLRVRTAQ